MMEDDEAPLTDAEIAEVKAFVRPAEGDGRPVIAVDDGKLHDTVTAAEKVLLGYGGARIYQRGGDLVRVARLSVETTTHGIKRQPGALVIVPVEEFYLTEALTSAANWLKLRSDGRGQYMKRIDAPNRIAKHLLARVGEWKFPPLSGLIETPTLRPDGSILATPGYDERTGILYDSGAAAFPSIADHPSRADAETAMRLLLEVLKDFPFIDESSRAAAVCEIVTPLIRRSLPTAPAFTNSAPTMGSGKSLLVDVASLIAVGHRAAAMAQAADDAEDQKRWLTALLAGDLLITIDNVSRPLGSDALNVILTQETFRARILGASKQKTVSTAVSVVATGNNIVVAGDLRTRVIPVSLDAKVERPEERRFDRNLLEWIPAHRGDLVHAALTVLRAFHVAGRPAQPEPVFGRFEAWSSWVRGMVVWLGLADPCDGRRALDTRDPVAANLNALLVGWRSAVGVRFVTVAEVIRTAEMPDNADLKGALVELAGDRGGGVSARMLAGIFRGFENRIAGGLRLARAGERHGTALWTVQEVASVASVALPISILDVPESSRTGLKRTSEATEVTQGPPDDHEDHLLEGIGGK